MRPAYAGEVTPPTPVPPVSRTQSWRTMLRCLALSLGLAVAAGVLALAILVLLDQRPGAPHAQVMWLLGVAQLASIGAAICAGLAVLRIGRGGDPAHAAAPLQSRLARIGTFTIGAVVGVAAVFLVAAPQQWFATLALAAVGVQPGIALRLLPPRL